MRTSVLQRSECRPTLCRLDQVPDRPVSTSTYAPTEVAIGYQAGLLFLLISVLQLASFVLLNASQHNKSSTLCADRGGDRLPDWPRVSAHQRAPAAGVLLAGRQPDSDAGAVQQQLVSRVQLAIVRRNQSVAAVAMQRNNTWLPGEQLAAVHCKRSAPGVAMQRNNAWLPGEQLAVVHCKRSAPGVAMLAQWSDSWFRGQQLAVVPCSACHKPVACSITVGSAMAVNAVAWTRTIHAPAGCSVWAAWQPIQCFGHRSGTDIGACGQERRE